MHFKIHLLQEMICKLLMWNLEFVVLQELSGRRLSRVFSGWRARTEALISKGLDKRKAEVFASHHSQLTFFQQWRHAAACCRSAFQDRLKAAAHAQAVRMGTAFQEWTAGITGTKLQTAKAEGNYFPFLLA